MSFKLKSIINLDKRTKISVVVGGIWGLISGRIIYHDLMMVSFAGGAILKYYLEPPILKILLLPAYLTHQLIFVPILELQLLTLEPSLTSELSYSLCLFFHVLRWITIIVMPILFGIGISLLAINLINKGKKVLKK